jgi:AraC-like DNA-binding protein
MDGPERQNELLGCKLRVMTGTPEYVEWIPRADLRGVVACGWAARFGDDGQPHAERVLPDGCVDLIWSGQRLLIAGPDTESTLLGASAGAQFAGVRLRAGKAAAVLGVPASSLLNARVVAHDIWGARADALGEALSRTCSAADAVAVMESALKTWLTNVPRGDALVAVAVSKLRSLRSSRPVADLADELGVSERQLNRRFADAVGYGPKMLQRVFRLQTFVRLRSVQPRRGLADLAAAAGYADQAHLCRDCQALAAAPPSALLGQPVTAS